MVRVDIILSWEVKSEETYVIEARVPRQAF